MNSRFFRLAVIYFMVATAFYLQGQTSGGKALQVVSAATQNPFDEFQSFSAILNGGIGGDHDRKVYRSGNLMRMDFDDSYRITDLKNRTTFGIQAASCVQVAMPDAGTYPFSAYRDYEVERSLIADKETVDGHICRIENVTFKPKDERPFLVKMKLWRAEELEGFPIRIEAETGGRKITLDYKNVSLNAPDPKLFAHPAKCALAPAPGQKDTIKLNAPSPKPGPKGRQNPSQ